MAYQKINVNTGVVSGVFASNTIPIPSPDLETITSSSTGVASGNADTNTINHLINSTLTGNDQFTSTVVPLPVLIGDRAIRTTGGGSPDSSLVQNPITATDLTLAADTFPDGNEAYTISRPNHLIDTTETFVTKGVSVGDVVLNGVTGVATRVSAVNNEVDLTLEDDLFSSNTGYNDTYTIFLGGQLPGSDGKSSEGCLLYVTSLTQPSTIATSYVDTIRVKTVAGNVVTFLNFPVGQYLPVQITQLYFSGTSLGSRNVCLAIW